MLINEKLQKAIESYNENGFAIIEDFLSDADVQAIKDEALRIIRTDAVNEKGPKHVNNPESLQDEYYSTAGDKCRFFYEPGAVDEENNKMLVSHEKGMCKMGFALHAYHKFFKDFVTSKRITEVFRALSYGNPTLIQTMINFKNPKVGGEFIPHQDASYLTTTDPKHLVGFWFALDDATVENGCLQVIPGSHKWNLNRIYTRPDKALGNGDLLVWTGPMALYEQKMYINIPAKKGALVLIHGLLLHKSDPNKTDKARAAFVFHAFDKARCRYVDGWIAEDCPSFIPLYAAAN